MKSNRISYIVPTLNSERYIERTIKSIYNNNFLAGDEIIVIDDSSNDNTPNILMKLKKQKKIHTLILLKKNVGEGAAKNIAIRKSKNKYFFCLDHDNILSSNSIHQLRTEIDRYSAVAFDTVKYFQFHPLNVTHKHEFKSGLISLKVFESSDNPGFTGNVLYQKKAWKKVKGFENVVLESWNFMYKFLIDKLQVYIVPNSFYYHRYGHQSAYTRATKTLSGHEILVSSRPKVVKKREIKYKVKENTKIHIIRYFISMIVRKLLNIMRIN